MDNSFVNFEGSDAPLWSSDLIQDPPPSIPDHEWVGGNASDWATAIHQTPPSSANQLPGTVAPADFDLDEWCHAEAFASTDDDEDEDG